MDGCAAGYLNLIDAPSALELAQPAPIARQSARLASVVRQVRSAQAHQPRTTQRSTALQRVPR